MPKPQKKIANCVECGLRYHQMDQKNWETMNANLAEETPVRNVGMTWYLECGYMQAIGGGLTPLAPPPPVSAPSTPLAPPPVSAGGGLTPLAPPPPVSAPTTAELLASKDDAIARALDNHPAVAGEPPCPSSPTSPSTEVDWG